jgi:hypothetical protein
VNEIIIDYRSSSPPHVVVRRPPRDLHWNAERVFVRWVGYFLEYRRGEEKFDGEPRFRGSESSYAFLGVYDLSLITTMDVSGVTLGIAYLGGR